MNVALRIETGRTARLDEATKAAIVRVCNDSVHSDVFDLLFSFLPPDGLHVIGYLGDELVSHAVATTRWLQTGTSPLLKTAYIDAVATATAYQGRRFGSVVMRRLAAEVATDYEAACLETSDAVGFYEKIGWQEWRGALAGRGEHGLIPTPDQKGIMVLRLPRTPELDFDGLLTIEDQGARIW